MGNTGASMTKILPESLEQAILC